MCRTTFLRVGCTLGALLFSMAVGRAVEAASSQPMPANAVSADHATNVLVLPLEPIGGNVDSVGEIARAVQKSIVQDISRSRQFHVTEGGAIPANRDAAITAGKSAGADFVVSGNIQHADDRVRVAGDVIDLAKGQPAGSFKVTGDTRDAFELQDQVAARVRLHLMRSLALAQNAQGETPETQRAEVPASEPLQARVRSIDPDWITPPAYANDAASDGITYRYNYGYPYDLPYWSIPYGYGNFYGLGYYPGYFGYGLGYGYGGYHYSFYRPWRPLYQHYSNGFYERGLIDRRTYYGFGPRVLRNFNGPIPMHSFSGPVPMRGGGSGGMHR